MTGEDIRKVRHPLNRSVTLVCAVFIGLLCIILSFVTYKMYTKAMYERYQKEMASIVTYVQSHIDNDDMSECADTFIESEKYKEFQEFFDNFIDNYEDVHYLYIMKVVGPDEPVQVYEVCAANSTYEKENEPEMVLHLGDGEADWFDDETAQHYREILEGDEDVYFVNPSTWGVDYTLCRPLIDSSGKHYALLCADISIDEISSTVDHNVYIMIGIILALGLLFIVLLILWMRKNVTGPVKELESSVTGFVNYTEGRRDPDELVFDAPDFQTGNEIESLRDAIIELSDEMRYYVKDMMAAEDRARGLQEHVTEISAIAFKDALTHVKNKASMDREEDVINEQIRTEGIEFGAVMMDVNYLKETNDRFGHDKGDLYLVGACRILCEVFAHSPVYRIGGDEFVVILRDRDYENREELLAKIRGIYDETAHDLEQDPWLQYSAAVGMAVYREGDDFDAVVKRADEEMYTEKKRIKSELRR